MEGARCFNGIASVECQRIMKALPNSREDWLQEIGRAFRDAAEAIPFGPPAGVAFGPGELFHPGPVTALKIRGIRRSRQVVSQMTEAVLASFVATTSEDGRALRDPRVAFAFTYLTSHFALGILAEEGVIQLMDYIEGHPEAIG
jgi:hypothetical protein